MTRKVGNGLDLQGQRVVAVGDPSTGTDAANKNYVDSVARGNQWRDAVRVASTANVNISSAPATIDGVTLASGDRVLLKNQTTGTENGIYIYNGSGSAMTRAVDMAAAAVIRPSLSVDVIAGSTNADQVWHITSPDTDVTVGTDATTWSQLGGGGGVSSFNTRTGGVTLTKADVTATGLAATDVGATRTFAANIGDGSTTAITVTHGLGTRDVHVSVHDASTFDEILPDVNKATTNTVVITFATAPGTNAYRVVVIG